MQASRSPFATPQAVKSMFTMSVDRGMCRKGKVREELRVLARWLVDRWHSEHWNQLVEDFFPLEVSQLFFFDAEKIRSLAEDETSSQVLGSAVKSLLGLDVAERLIARRELSWRRIWRKKMEASEVATDDRAELEKRDRGAWARVRRHEDKAGRA